MPDPKMKKCRNCDKDVKVEDEQNFDFVHDCGWSEAKARAEVRKGLLMSQIVEEFKSEAEKGKKKGDKDKGLFGW